MHDQSRAEQTAFPRIVVPPATEAPASPIRQMSRLELAIIALAAHPRERARRRWPARVLSRLVWGNQRPLASRRLEALRGFAACLHTLPSPAASSAATADFVAAGWSTAEAAAVRLVVATSGAGRTAFH
jgi:hypothetical protein